MLTPLAEERDRLWLLVLDDANQFSAFGASEPRPFFGSLGSLSDWDIVYLAINTAQ
jgi:hypothetical protein